MTFKEFCKKYELTEEEQEAALAYLLALRVGIRWKALKNILDGLF